MKEMRKFATAALLMVTMVLTMFLPMLSATSLAAGKVYYSVDFSQAMYKISIEQVPKGCGVASMYNIEAYMHGATSKNDTRKMKEVVEKVNGGQISGNWETCGYEKKPFDINRLYEEISRGNPVIVHRYGHYSVVCGYVGSTTKLEESGFIVLNVTQQGCDLNSRLNVWKKSYTLDQMVIRKNGVAYSGFSGIRIGVNYPEIVHQYGAGFGVYGRIDSNNNITEVTVSIINANIGTVGPTFTKTIKPNSKSVPMLPNFDSAFQIRTLSVGNYYYYIYVKDSSGATKTFCKYFTISNSYPSSRPADPVYSFKYDMNGGTGSVSGCTRKFMEYVPIQYSNTILKPGYKLTGWNCKRSDGKWYCSGQGWFTDSEISSKKYTKKLYKKDDSYQVSQEWLKNGGNNPYYSYTFYAVWEEELYNLCPFENYSEKNMIPGSDCSNPNNMPAVSRNTDVAVLSLDTTVQHNGYNTLKVESFKPGDISHDYCVYTNLNSDKYQYHYADGAKTLTISFWAKSSVENNAVKLRWTHENASTTKTINLTTDWKYYTLRFDKPETAGTWIAFFNTQKGTVWYSEMQLENGTEATAFVPETGKALATTQNRYGGTYTLPATPTREGYKFTGWYSEPNGGTEITSSTPVKAGHFVVYAHWEKVANDSTDTPSNPGTTETPSKPSGTTTAPSKPSGTTETPSKPSGTTTTPSKPGTTETPSKPSGTTTTPSKPGTTTAPTKAGVGDFVERLYTIALDRQSDPNGKAEWEDRVRTKGYTGADVAEGFLYSPEFLGKEMSDSDFLNILYKVFFDREPDAAGKQDWLNRMANGLDKKQVIRGFIDSTEWANVCLKYGIPSGGLGTPSITIPPTDDVYGFVTRIYTNALGRKPDDQGLEDWATRLSNMQIGGSEAALGFFHSPEFLNNKYSDEEYVTRLYRTFMNREPDSQGYQYWLGQLAGGSSRDDVFDGFAGSQEWAGICVQYGIIK